MRQTLLLALTALVAAAPAAARQAEHAGGHEPRSVRVSYADLNLATDAGMAKFQRRLAGAIKRVCPVDDGANLQHRLDSRKCIAAAKARLTVDIAAAKQAQAVALASRPTVTIAAQ